MDFNCSIAIKIKRNKLVNRSILIDKKGKLKSFMTRYICTMQHSLKEKSILSQKHLQQEKNYPQSTGRLLTITI